MKGVDGCDKPRGAVIKLRSGDTRMGKPTWAIPRYHWLNI
jgi:hypothetical protein